MSAALRTHLTVAAVAFVAGAALLSVALRRDAMDAGVRRIGVQVSSGRILRSAPPGQLLRCDFAGLQRVEVLLSKRCPPDVEPTPVVLEVRRVPEDAALAEVLAAAPERIAPKGEIVPREEGDLRAFRFDPIEDSAGATFHLRLVPADGADRTHWAPFVAIEGTRGETTPPGPILEERPVALELRPYHLGLSHIAVGFERLSPEDGEVSLDLFRLPDDRLDPPEDFPPRRVGGGRLAHGATISSGWGVFRIDLDEDVRFVPLRAVLTVPEGTLVLGRDGVPRARAFHRRSDDPVADPALPGMTLGATVLEDRDLCLRIYGGGGVGANLARLHGHGGLWRAALGLVLWTLTATAALAALLRRPGPSD